MTGTDHTIADDDIRDSVYFLRGVDDPAGRFRAAAGDRARVLAIGEELALA